MPVTTLSLLYVCMNRGLFYENDGWGSGDASKGVSRDPTRRLGPRLERPWAVVCLPLDPQPQRTRT